LLHIGLQKVMVVDEIGKLAAVGVGWYGWSGS